MSIAEAHSHSELQTLVGRLVREALAARRSAHPPHAEQKSAAVAAIRIPAAVVSLGVLEQLPEDARRVEIEPRAVLTPAASDLLRQRGIQVLRAGAAPRAADRAPGHTPAGNAATGAGTWWIADAEHPERGTAYVRQLASRGIDVCGLELPLQSDSPRTGSVGVVVADLPAVHVDHFARQRCLASAAVGALPEVARIAAAMSPAVWVLDAQRLSISGRIAVAAECFRRSAEDSGNVLQPGASR